MDLSFVAELKNNLEEDNIHSMVMNVASKGVISDLMINRKESKSIDHTMSKMLDVKTKPTNQRSSGRCWMFAGLNLLRTKAIKTKKLPSSFEFSQSYLFFWDKLERSLFFLKKIVELKTLPNNNRIMESLYKELLSDGGQWDMFVNLVEKYGIVPQMCFTESHSTSFSRNMNNYLKKQLKEFALILRGEIEDDKFTGTDNEKIKEMMKIIYKMLSLMIGSPMLPNEVVEWNYHDKDSKHHVLKKTPLQFYNELKVDLSNYQCVVSDVRNPYHKMYTVEHMGNVVGMKGISYLNLPIETLKKLTKAMIDEGEPVWFCCDVGAERWKDKDWCSTTILKPELLFSTEFKMNKKARMLTWDSVLTHAMVISGYNAIETEGHTMESWTGNELTIVKSKTSKINRWRIENSWGSSGFLGGFLTMTDKWYDEYVFEIAVPKELLEKQEITLEVEHKTLPVWDQMGSAAY